MSETLKVQISRTVQNWLDGTHVGQLPKNLDEHGYGWEGQHLIRKIDEAPRTRKDGSVTVHLLPQEAAALADLADTMHQSNLDEFSMFGEARAGAALVEKLRVLGVNVPPMRHVFGTDPNPYDDGDGDGGTGDGSDSPSPWCPTCGCPDGWRADGPRAVRGGHGCSRGDECPDCPTNAERHRRYLEQTATVDVPHGNANRQALDTVLALRILADAAAELLDDRLTGTTIHAEDVTDLRTEVRAVENLAAEIVEMLTVLAEEIDDDDEELIRIEPQDVDADGRMTFRPAEDRIVVTVDDHGVYRAQPYSALYDPPGTIAVSIRIRDLDTSGQMLRTVDDVRSLRYYLADAIAQAEEWDRQTFGLYDFEIRTESVGTIPA